MNRLEAMALLKELVADNLVEPNYIHICERKKPNHYQIQIKCDYNKKELEEYAKKHNLSIEEDKEKNYLAIFKP